MTFSVSSADSTLLSVNPLRYRGYIYDTETGFYYLQSRYYDPEVGRFINADGQLNGGFLGNNLYAYCVNNPTNYYDDFGNSPKKITYRIDDKGKATEHIHIEYNGKKYSWYLDPVNKDSRHKQDLGYGDLTDTLKKNLSKAGIPSRYLNINKHNKTMTIINNTNVTITPITTNNNSVDVTPMEVVPPYIETFPSTNILPYSIEDFPMELFNNRIEIETYPMQNNDSNGVMMVIVLLVGVLGAFSGGIPSGISY